MKEVRELKKIHPEAIGHALEKADRYRLLNDPEQAESICRDVLAIDPEDEGAKKMLLLALTDQFASSSKRSRAKEARALAQGLGSEYERHYYTGLVLEREARSYLTRMLSGTFACEAFLDAMDCYEKAEAVRPTGDDDAILRWNACLRTIQTRKLKPREHEHELPLE